MLAPVLVTPPADMPVTLEEAKVHLRVEHDEEDALIENLIRAATGHLDGWTGVLGRALMPQTWRQSYLSHGLLRLGLAPVREVQGVTYYDSDGNEQTVDPDDYRLLTDDLGAYVQVSHLPSVARRQDAVSVVYEAGYDEVPAPLRAAILLLVGHWFENREAVVTGTSATSLPLAVDMLIAPFRRAI